MFTDDWKELTADQRFAARMDAWQNTPVEFASPEVGAAFRERVQLWRDAIELRKPARVPITPWIGLFPLRYSGFTGHDAYYDYAKLGQAWDKFHADFRPDGLAMTIAMVPGKVFDILDYKLYDWPGHGVPNDASYQYNEREWMKDDEYDLLIADPSNYWQRFYVPRMFGALEPWQTLAPFTDLCEAPFTAPFFVPFALPPVKQMLQKMMDAGDAAMEWLQAFMAIDGKQMATLGIPQMAGSSTKAPYDILGDTMRGTRGLMLDKFRRPEKVKAAMARLVPLAIDWALRSADATRNPVVFIPIHKGADGFMSDEDYRTLYWPTFKAVLLGLIEQGLVPMVFAEGAYNERLEVIADPEIPRGRMIWMFDDTDMARAKKIVGARQAIGGNVPGSLLTMGTPERVDAYVKDLLAKTAGNGGFFLGTGIVLDEADPACFKAFCDAGRTYGAAV
jgi:hypothetical protein